MNELAEHARMLADLVDAATKNGGDKVETPAFMLRSFAETIDDQEERVAALESDVASLLRGGHPAQEEEDDE